MRRALAALGVLALIACGGCSSQPATNAEESSGAASVASTLEAELTVNSVVNADGSVTVTATSNLPEGTELNSSVFAEGQYMAQDTAVLQGGQATFGPFSAKGAPLPAGTYDVGVTMPIAGNQPGAVKAVIGEHGEDLTGPQVSQEVATGDAVVEATEELVIP